MIYSRQWLMDHLAPNLTLSKFVSKLKQHHIQAHLLPVTAFHFSGVIVGKILTIAPHPNADKLQVCTVDIGALEHLSIVCGAQNIYLGMKVPVAPVGAILPGDFKIKKAKLRGELSFGMLCSAKELGLAENSVGIMGLPKDAPVGENLYEYLHLNDEIIALSRTDNEGNELSIEELSRLFHVTIENKTKKNNWLKKLLKLVFKL